MFKFNWKILSYRPNSLVVVCLLLFFAVAYISENKETTITLQQTLQTDSVPTALLEYGTRGKILEHLNLLEIKSNDGKRFPRTENFESDLEQITFQKKRRVGSFIFKVHDKTAASHVASQRQEPLSKAPYLPVITLNIDAESLFNQGIGIVTNYQKRGGNWERLSHMTVQHSPEIPVQLSTIVGIRLNDFPLNLRGEKNNYRLYFRKKYGMESVPDIFFQKDQKRSEQFVPNLLDILFIRHELTQPILKYLAYEIARMSGCTANQSRFAEIIINERSYGRALLTTKLSARAISNHYKPGTFVLADHSPYFSIADFVSNNNFLSELPLKKENLNQQRIFDVIDHDNFSRYIFVLAFLGVSIGEQQTLLHISKDGLRLKWILNSLEEDLLWGDDLIAGTIPQSWNHPGLMPFVQPRKRTHDTGIIFSKLLKNSPEFKRRFIYLAVHLLNHELRPEKILEKMEVSTHPDNPAVLASIREYLVRRNDFMRGDLQQVLDLGESVSLTIKGSQGTNYLVDGSTEQTEYRGKYFSGQKVHVSLTHTKDQLHLSHWLVNGAPFVGDDLTLQLDKNVIIEPIFNN